MSSMDDLIAFVTARLDEDEDAVREVTRAHPGPWSEDKSSIRDAGGDTVIFDEYRWGGSVFAHIAHHDPARVLREVGGSHIGRSWQGHGIEDECPCPKAPCGLVVQETVSEACDQHPLSAGRTIRQGHRADQCPAVPAAEQPAPELAAAKRAIAEYERLARTGTIPDAGRRAEIRAGLETP